MKIFFLDLSKFSIYLFTFIFVVSFLNYEFSYSGDFFSLSKNKTFIIAGDSHIEFAFDDSNSNFVNIGQSGELYLFTYLKIKNIVLNNPQVKAVFIDFCNFQIKEERDNFLWSNEAYLTTYYPIYSPLLEQNDYKLIWDKNSKALINAHFKSIFKGSYHAINNKNISHNNILGGHQNLKSELTDKIIKSEMTKSNRLKTKKFKLSNTNLYNLERTIKFCYKHNVKVYFIRCPINPNWDCFSNEYFFQNVRQTRFSNIPFLDFKDFPINNSEFADLEHLNQKGTKKFTDFFNKLVGNNLLEKIDKQSYINQEIHNLQIN